VDVLEQLGRIMCEHRGIDPDSNNYDGDPFWLVYSRGYKMLAEALEGEYVIIPARIHDALKKECGL